MLTYHLKGGRYGLVDPSRQTMVYANTQDSVSISYPT